MSAGNGKEVKEHFDSIAGEYDLIKEKNSYYYDNLKKLYGSIVPPNKTVLEIGCGTGQLLHHLKPVNGIGIDISPEMITVAKKNYGDMRFEVSSAEKLKLREKFDYIILADVIEHLHDVWDSVVRLKDVSKNGTKVVISFINPLWEPVLKIGEALDLKMDEGPHNRLSKEDIINILKLNGFIIRKTGQRIHVPKRIPLISDFLNAHTHDVPGLRKLCLVQYIVAEYKKKKIRRSDLSCSVIIPCYNEEGNIKNAIERVPKMGKFTEIVVVDDGSADNTSKVVRDVARKNKLVKLVSYPVNRGKGHAVKEGFNKAAGDVLMILDADMTVPPEELPRFFSLIEEGKGEFVNGSRMIYPMEKQAMRTLHIFGNYIFGKIFSWLLGRRVTDTLCGTKALLKNDYKKIKMEKCKWGDFDLLFGAAKLGLKLVEMPVHYRKRVAGESKMNTWKHGFVLFKMCFRGFRELKLGFL